jgi:hypothetical protein
MKSIKPALLLAACLSTLVSCSNDADNEVKNGLEGIYTFVAMKADTYAEVTHDYDNTEADIKEVRAISTCTYQTTNNNGIITINASKFNSSKFAYSIHTTVIGKFYTNGKPSGNSSLPWAIEIPESSGTASYQLVGTDSIYFSGGFVNSPVLGDSVASLPSGAKYKWEGDTLVIASSFILRDTVREDGATVYSDKRSTQIMRFQKQ